MSEPLAAPASASKPLTPTQKTLIGCLIAPIAILALLVIVGLFLSDRESSISLPAPAQVPSSPNRVARVSPPEEEGGQPLEMVSMEELRAMPAKIELTQEATQETDAIILYGTTTIPPGQQLNGALREPTRLPDSFPFALELSIWQMSTIAADGSYRIRIPKANVEPGVYLTEVSASLILPGDQPIPKEYTGATSHIRVETSGAFLSVKTTGILNAADAAGRQAQIDRASRLLADCQRLQQDLLDLQATIVAAADAGFFVNRGEQEAQFIRTYKAKAEAISKQVSTLPHGDYRNILDSFHQRTDALYRDLVTYHGRFKQQSIDHYKAEKATTEKALGYLAASTNWLKSNHKATQE